MLKWPERAKRAVAVFFVKWNDFDVFVEDTAKNAASVYSELISRLVQKNCKVSRVIPLGDRQKVVSAAVQDVAKGGRRRLYLIDGDLDVIAGTTVPIAERLFVHPVYHVENYFFCENAIVQIIHEENPRFSPEEIRDQVDFMGFETYAKSLLYLFCVFGLTRSLDPSLPTISLGVGLFSTNQKLDEQKIRSFCFDRISELSGRFSQLQLINAQDRIDAIVRESPVYFDLVSARDYLLPVLRWWLADRGLHLPANKESLMFRLARACNVERHDKLATALRKCATDAT